MIRLMSALILLTVTCAAQTSGKKRVAVLDFDYGTVQSYVSSIYGSNQDVGKGITDMLVEKLVKDGKYSVIERKAIVPPGMEAVYEKIRYAPAVKVGNTIYVSGQIGRDAAMQLVEGREAQMVQGSSIRCRN